MTAAISDALSGAAEAGLNATQKVCAVLRALAGRSPVALRDLAEATELNKVTVFRIRHQIDRADQADAFRLRTDSNLGRVARTGLEPVQLRLRPRNPA